MGFLELRNTDHSEDLVQTYVGRLQEFQGMWDMPLTLVVDVKKLSTLDAFSGEARSLCILISQELQISPLLQAMVEDAWNDQQLKNGVVVIADAFGTIEGQPLTAHTKARLVARMRERLPLYEKVSHLPFQTARSYGSLILKRWVKKPQ